MFERLTRFLLRIAMLACIGLHGIVHAAPGLPGGMAAVAGWQQRLDPATDSNDTTLTAGVGADCPARKQICHGDWLETAAHRSIRMAQGMCPPLGETIPQASSWVPDVLQKPPRI